MKQIQAVYHEKCSGCRLCELVCSFFQTEEKTFQPSSAYIQVHRVDKTNRFHVEILSECVRCGLCAHYCEYGVLATS